MSTELFLSTIILISLAILRLGVPLLMLWLLGKGLRYLQTALP